MEIRSTSVFNENNKTETPGFRNLGEALKFDPNKDVCELPSSEKANRGQAGASGFTNGHFYKADPPATLLAECSADYVKSYIDQEKPAVNLAEIDKFNGAPASKQTMLEGWTTFDKAAIGRPRNSKSLKDEVDCMRATPKIIAEKFTADAKRQLGDAIFASVLAGDESMHLGQFMLKKDDKGNITDIKRIDLGAAHRYAHTRNLSGDNHPLHTSDHYSVTRDYMKVLLQDKNSF